MKAVRYHSYGDSDVLVYEEADRPVAAAGRLSGKTVLTLPERQIFPWQGMERA